MVEKYITHGRNEKSLQNIPTNLKTPSGNLGVDIWKDTVITIYLNYGVIM
jgi:hypothetical protein